MPTNRSRFSWMLLVAAPLLAAIGYYCSWRSGCVFDSKQATGDFQAGSHWALIALCLTASSYLAIAIAVPLMWRPTVVAMVGSLLFFGVLLVPTGMLMLMAAEGSGARACSR